MSQELERVYTINLGKVLLSPNNQRAKRAINMIKEFARHHMKTEEIKIEEDVAQQVWSRGIRSPPRKIRVRMTKTDEGYILVSPYEDEAIKSEKEKKSSKKEKPVVEEVKPIVEETTAEAESTEPKPKEAPKEPKTKPKAKEGSSESKAKETKAASKPKSKESAGKKKSSAKTKK